MKKIFFTIFIMLVMAANPASAVPVDVFAQANSTAGGVGGSTGVFLNTGDNFTVSAAATDLWSAGSLPRWSNADGLTGDLFATGSDESGQVAGTRIGVDFGLYSAHGLSLAFGSLVGSIGGDFFLIGTNFTGNAIGTGELLLWYWDSNNGDNSEKIKVTIDTAAVPEPSVLALLSLGLVSLISVSRRKKI